MTLRSGTVEVNGARIYHEVRGDGPSVLFISGATGDAGHYSSVAAGLADEFTTITYDRRGNSRSPAPAGWTTTSIDEQADDAAALVTELGVAPVAVFGSSGGGAILTNLLVRRPEAVRGATIHEPVLVPVLPYAAELMSGLMEKLAGALADGPRAGMEAFVRAAAGDAAFDGLDASTRERMLGNGELFFGTELQPMGSYAPDDVDLVGVRVPVFVAAGADNRDPSSPNHYLWDTSEWAASAFGVDVIEFPGGHTPYFSHPEETAEILRPLLRKMG